MSCSPCYLSALASFTEAMLGSLNKHRRRPICKYFSEDCRAFETMIHRFCYALAVNVAMRGKCAADRVILGTRTCADHGSGCGIGEGKGDYLSTVVGTRTGAEGWMGGGQGGWRRLLHGLLVMPGLLHRFSSRIYLGSATYTSR